MRNAQNGYERDLKETLAAITASRQIYFLALYQVLESHTTQQSGSLYETCHRCNTMILRYTSNRSTRFHNLISYF